MKKTNQILKTELLIPSEDPSRGTEIEVSIVVPALNEEITISEFIDWCFEGIEKAGVSAEIIIIDSSSDNTPKIALSKGARVLRTPKRGLGQAYIDAIPFIRGDFIIMGDCDLTYDFREIKVFVDSYKKGNEFVMGSRFSGSIEDGSMPKLHRYFGTPLTTWILNIIYHSNYNDIHCGMRGLTKNALIKINLTSKGWEYASEMVLKAWRMNFQIDEVPVNFYKDKEGRLSHHKRAGFWSPWYAGWINLKAMLIFSPDSFLIKPGIALMIFGIAILILALFGLSIGPVVLEFHSFLLAIFSILIGVSFFQMGIVTRLFHGLRNGIELKILNNFTYERGMLAFFIFFIMGLGLEAIFLIQYINDNYVLKNFSNLSITGLTLLIFSIQIFSFNLLLELLRRTKKVPS